MLYPKDLANDESGGVYTDLATARTPANSLHLETQHGGDWTGWHISKSYGIHDGGEEAKCPVRPT